MAASTPRPKESLSIDEARRIALRSQGLIDGDGSAQNVPAMLRQLGAVQLDTISVLARSHELVAYARLGPVPRREVEAAYWSEPATAFEYHGHANCILPIELWPHFAFKRRSNSERTHPWFSVHEQEVDEVRARLRDGPVTASDLGGAREGNGGWWSWSAAKRAVELLYYRGEVVCTDRRGWKRVYDLPERALPPELLSREPSDAECVSHLVGLAARALGIGTRRDIMEYFRLATRTLGARAAASLVDQAIEEHGLVPVEVEGWKEIAFATQDALSAPVRGKCRTTLLSPFDSLIWATQRPGELKERERIRRVFDFSFSFEAYVPKEKRTHGYFVMPLLAGGRLVGRVDPARRGKTLVIRKASLDDPEAAPAMAAALREAATWVGCDEVVVESVYPPGALDGQVI